MRLTLSEIRHETPDALSFIFEPQRPFSWQPGQFLRYTLPHLNTDDRGIERYFSIASAPIEGHIRLTTNFAEPGSSFKQTLKAMRPGDKIEVKGPEGDFVIDDPSEEMVWIAGGSGITAFRAMLMDLDHREFPVHASLLYANRDNDFIFKDELEALARKHKNFSIHYFVSPKRLDESAIRELVPDIKRPVFYLSGPEQMVESLEETLRPMGVPPSHVRTDHLPGYDWP